MKYFAFTSALISILSIVAAEDCPPGIIPTPQYGTANAVFTVCSYTDINAPAQNVYNIIKNFDGYPNWNTFVVHVTKTSPGPYGLNTTMTFSNAMIFPLVDYPSDEIIMIWDASQTSSSGFTELVVAWGMDTTTPELMAAEHVSIVRDYGNATSRYVSWETFYGPEAVAVEVVTGAQLKNAFAVQGQDLKGWAESGHTM